MLVYIFTPISLGYFVTDDFRNIVYNLILFINHVEQKFIMPRGMKKGLNTAKFDRCVSKVKSKSGKKANPYAVCNSTMSGKSKGRDKNSSKR
jgi:hypothetical protein